ncbi:CAN9 protein, partial [Polypterus senegalus]
MGNSCSCSHTTVTQIHVLHQTPPGKRKQQLDSCLNAVPQVASQSYPPFETHCAAQLNTSRDDVKQKRWDKITAGIHALIAVRQRGSEPDLTSQGEENASETEWVAKSEQISSQYQQIMLEIQQSGKAWEDPEFPPVASSLTYEDVAQTEINWLRALRLHPKACFMEDGVSKSDIIQGELGDCWFWASVATVLHSRKLITQVIPSGQTILEGGSYTSVFRFHFWQFGSWVEVLVDDFLPVRHGQLIYARSAAKNEFWPSLLEKAFAKLHGSYKAIEGGWTLDALTDLTGGVGEMYRIADYANHREHLYEQLATASRKRALITCGTSQLTTPRGRMPLVRILNPWGSGQAMEWTGDWGDSSPLWDEIPVWTREAFGFTKKDDGEFWYDVSPDEKGDDEDGRCSVLICLLQSFNRRDRKLGLKMNPIGLQIYRTDEPESTLTIDMLAKQAEEADSGPYVAQRSINLRCQLTVGSYVIIPSTFSPGATGSYMLRIFTEEPVLVHEALNFCSCDI